MRIHTFYILPIIFIFGLGTLMVSPAHAQEGDEGDTEQTEQATEGEDTDVQFEGNGEGEAGSDGENGGFLNSLLFWQNWGPPDAPEEPSPWHAEVSDYLQVEDDEYVRYGYTRINERWLPIFFLRRFEMMDKQYVHTLVIKGHPEKSPKIKGIEMGELGMEVSHLGFDVRMPKFPSVARAEKDRDEEEAIELCEIQLELYGFHEVAWMPGDEEELRNLAETWDTE